MSRLFSWVGITDLKCWKNRNAEGPLISVAQKVRPKAIDLLWDFSESEMEYQQWLEGVLSEKGTPVKITIHRFEDSNVMNFLWVYETIQRFKADLVDGTFINASSGTPMMLACWIILKKAEGVDLRLFTSSRDHGVVEVELPKFLSVAVNEIAQGTRTPLYDRFLKGELGVSSELFDGSTATSSSMKEVLLKASCVARFSDIPVLILGPPGSGKTTLAKYLHQQSKFSGEFETVDCGMLSHEVSRNDLFGWKKGAFTGADNDNPGRISHSEDGTLFLDEIGNSDPQTQKNLLRLLQEKKYRPLNASKDVDINTRIIAATNSSLRTMVSMGEFRQDLLDRLSVFVIEIPPLAHRRDDIEPTAIETLRKLNQKWAGPIEDLGGVPKQFSDGAIKELRKYKWPGNYRELENVIKRLVVDSVSRTSQISPDDVRKVLAIGDPSFSTDSLPPLTEGFDLVSVVRDIQYKYLVQAWDECDGNRSEIAKRLGFKSRSPIQTMQKEFEKHGLSMRPFE